MTYLPTYRANQLIGSQTRCSSCTQPYEASRFLTCESCRRQNRESKRRRTKEGTDYNTIHRPPPTTSELENTLSIRQEQAGKQAQGWVGYRALTVEDYVREPTQEEKQAIQAAQEHRTQLKQAFIARKAEHKATCRELRVQRGIIEDKEEFNKWWDKREEELKRWRIKERQRRRQERQVGEVASTLRPRQ